MSECPDRTEIIVVLIPLIVLVLRGVLSRLDALRGVAIRGLVLLVGLQYYGEILSKKPVELHRFYTDESTFCHASGTKEEVSE